MTKQEQQNRKFLMGFAALWVMFYHSMFGMPGPVLAHIKLLGFVGADIFLFLSGIGCYHSMQNNFQSDFLRHRIIKTMPTYYIYILPFIVYKAVAVHVPIRCLIGNLTVFNPLNPNGVYIVWYVCVMWVCYLLAPWLNEFIGRHSWRRDLQLLALLVLFAPTMACSGSPIMISTRIPVFYLGMLHACDEERQRLYTHRVVPATILSAIGLVALLVLYDFVPHDISVECGLCYITNILTVPGIVIWLTRAGTFIRKCKIGEYVSRCVEYVGTFSYDLLLSHMFAYNVLCDMFSEAKNQRLVWIIGSVAAIAVAAATGWFTKKIVVILSKRKRQRDA